MAFDFFGSEEDREKQEQQNQVTGSQQMLGQQSPIVTGNNNQQQQDGAGTGSGSFTNLQSYLDANKSLNFGSQVAGKVDQRTGEAEKAQDETETGFKGQVDQNTVKPDEDLIRSAADRPEDIVADPNKLAGWAKMRDARYQGPNNLADDDAGYMKAQGATSKAKTLADQTRDEGGRKALLQQEYGAGIGRYDYTPGQTKLDNLLISNDPSSRQAFEQSRARAGATDERFSGLKTALDTYAGQGKGTTEAARAASRAAVGIDDAGNVAGNGAIQKNLGQIDAKVAERRAALKAEQDAMAPIAGKRNVGELQDYIAKMGINPEEFGGTDITGDYGGVALGHQGINVDPGYLFNVDPGDQAYNKFTPEGDINRGSVSNGEQIARMRALSQLANVDQTFIPNEIDVGKYDDGSFANYQGSAFRDTVGNQRGAYTADMKKALADAEKAANPGPDGYGNTNSGIIDSRAVQRAINAVRTKYGLGAVGNY